MNELKHIMKLLVAMLSIMILWLTTEFYTVNSEKKEHEPLSVHAHEESKNDVEEQSNQKMYRAYKSVIKELLIRYGKGKIQDDTFSPSTYCLDGLGVVRLLDLDKDGQNELITIGYQYDHYELKIFYFDGEKAVQVYLNTLCRDIAPTDFIGKGGCYGFNYYDNGDKIHVLTDNKYGVFYNLKYSELKNNEMVVTETISYEFNQSTKLNNYYINEKIVSEEDYDKKADDFRNKTIDIQCSGSTVKTMQSVLDETNKILKKLGYSITASEKRYAAYRNKVEELIGIYGKPSIRNEYYGGVAFVKLIDFDDDGNEELYCAYAEKSGRVDQQEIFGFENNKVVSLFKGDINNFGTYIEPLIKFKIDDCKVYILSGNQKTENGNQGIYIGIKNGQSITNSGLDSSFDYAIMVRAFGYQVNTDPLRETKSTMDELGCNEYNIINKAEYDRQLIIYIFYIESDKWKNTVGVENLNSIHKLFFDYDGDGILEMWYESSLESSLRAEKFSLFCTLKNNNVFELINTYKNGGHITLSYCETNDKTYIEVFDHARGFVGATDSLTAYTMSDGILKKTAEYTLNSYSSGIGESVFTVSTKNVTPEEEEKFENSYHNIDQDTAEQILFNTSYAVSIKEKLKE